MSVRQPVKQSFYLDQKGRCYKTAIEAIEQDLFNLVDRFIRYKADAYFDTYDAINRFIKATPTELDDFIKEFMKLRLEREQVLQESKR